MTISLEISESVLPQNGTVGVFTVHSLVDARGGGGGTLTPNFCRRVQRQSEKMRGYGASSSVKVGVSCNDFV